MANPQIELHTLHREPSSEGIPHSTETALEHEHHEVEFYLPPVDRGKDAWLFLAAAFVVEALVWGFPFSFGVFQDYYSTHPPFAGSRNIAVIGTCATGIMYIDLPVIFAVMQRWPKTRWWCTPVGLLTMCLALSLSSFSTTTTHLMVTQGVFYAIGGSMAYAPCILYVDEWFVTRKGLAFGIMWAGTGLAGVILPFLMQYLLETYGYKTTLRAWAVALFLMNAPLLYFVKPRLPLAASAAARRLDFTFIRTKVFSLHQLGSTIQALGFFLPTIYMPTYARSLGASSVLAALPVVLFNIASVFGSVSMGSIVDRYHVTTCIFISTAGATLSVFLIWGMSLTLAPLYIFAIIYGFFAGSFTSTWSGVMRDVKARKRTAEPGLIFACLAAGRGVGNVVSGPLSELLIRGQAWKTVGGGGLGYGTGFGPLIVFTGVTAMLGGASVVSLRARS